MSDFAQYKVQAMTDLAQDTNLDKAADLAAQRRVLLDAHVIDFDQSESSISSRAHLLIMQMRFNL